MRKHLLRWLIVTLAAGWPLPALAADDCPAGHVRNAQISPLDHDYMVRAYKASFRGLFNRDPTMQPGSGLDDGEYYIAAADHFGVYGDDQCHAGWSGYWESWLQNGHGDLTRVQQPAHFLPSAPMPTPQPEPTPAPQPQPAPLPSIELTAVLDQQALDHAILLQMQIELAATHRDLVEFREAVRSKWVTIVDSPVFKYGLAALSGYLLTHKWGG